MLGNKKTNAFIEAVHTATGSSREVANIAIAYVVVRGMLQRSDELSATDVKLRIKRVVNDICELVIVDRVALEAAVNNMYQFYTQQHGELRRGDIFSVTSFEDVIKLNVYFSSATIQLVSDHITIFKTISAALFDIKDTFIEE